MRETLASTACSNCLGAAVLSKITWRLVPPLFFLYVVAYVDRINIGFAAPPLKSQLHLSDADYGFAAGIFFAGYVLFQLPSNVVLQRVGARRWIAALTIAWGVVSSCITLVRAPWQLYALRFLLGSAEAGFFAGVIFYLRSWFPAAARAKTMALFAAGGPVSAVVAGPLCGALLGVNRAGLAGWQWMFFLEGAPAVILGVGAFFYLANSPAEVDWLSLEERTWIAREMRQEGQDEISSQTWRLSERIGILPAFTSLSVWLLVAVYFGLTCAGYGITFWLPSLIHTVSGAGTTMIGFLSTIPYAAAAVVMVLAGSDADRSGERRWHIAVPALLGALALVWAGYSSSLPGLMALISFAVVAQFCMVGPFWALSSMVEPRHSAAVIALINSLGNLGGLAGSYAIGALRNSAAGFRNGMVCVGLSLGVAGCLVLLVGKKERRFAKAI